jgi:hypothetical protein
MRFSIAVWVLALSFSAALAPLANAETVAFNYQENFNYFGDQANFSCGGKGACGAVSSVNSFIFLENQYPTIYANDVLTPNYDPLTNTDQKDAQNFGFSGFGPYQGYYPRPGDAYGDYIQTLEDWFTNYSPGNTILNAWYSGSNDYDYAPGILDIAGEIQANEDVEFFVQGTSFFHVMTMTGIQCDQTNKNCTITYQDPNAPTVQQTANLIIAPDGSLSFTGVPGSGQPNLTVNITGMFSESPTPEPSTFVLIGGGLLGLFAARKRAVTGA